MKLRNTLVPVALAVLLPFVVSPASAAIINGDFEAGDFTGWTVSAIDEVGDPISPDPFLSVMDLGGNKVAQIKTGKYADGLFVATLEQAFVIAAGEPYLTFEFTLPIVVPDATGSGLSPFLDAFFVSLESSAGFHELLLVDQFGALADPFGTAPGTVTLGAPRDPAFDYRFGADLTALIGETVTLYLDVVQENDGFAFDPIFDYAGTGPLPATKPIIPEPSALLVWAGLGLICAVTKCGRRRRRH